MKGQLLEYSIQSNTGVISGSDGDRYQFTGSEWKDTVPPSRGMTLDFDTNDKSAVDVYRAVSQKGVPSNGEKSKPVATLLAFFLGGIGIHKFYMGSWGWGIIYLIFVASFIPMLAAIIEGINYLYMSDEEFTMKAEAFKDKGPFGFFW